MVERDSLENCCVGNSTGGSNPPSSAKTNRSLSAGFSLRGDGRKETAFLSWVANRRSHVFLKRSGRKTGEPRPAALSEEVSKRSGETDELRDSGINIPHPPPKQTAV